MYSVTVDRIDALRRHIADAVTQTSRSSTLPEPEQDRILQQACAEACELLGDWLGSQPLRPPEASDVPVRELLRDQQQFADFLSPLFADALERTAESVMRLSGDGRDDPAGTTKAAHDAIVQAAHEEVAKAVRAASATARRFPRMRTGQLFQLTTKNVGTLTGQVCGLAAQLSKARAGGQPPGSADRLRQKARKLLPAVGKFLLGLSVSLVLTTAGPQQVVQNVAAWTHGVPVVMAHYLAAAAQPGVTIAPPNAGLQPR